jgi:hypothetical protein
MSYTRGFMGYAGSYAIALWRLSAPSALIPTVVRPTARRHDEEMLIS